MKGQALSFDVIISAIGFSILLIAMVVQTMVQTVAIYLMLQIL
jgi:uncharacterized membrane protein